MQKRGAAVMRYNLGNEKWEQNGHNIRLVSILFLIKKGNECKHEK